MAVNIVSPKAPPAPILPPDIAPDFTLIQQQFPKIGEKMSLMWGSVVLQDYLSKTIFDERGGRQGFPMPIVSALMRLYEYHSKLIPDVSGKNQDTWDDVK
jgi:hypothetical protein